jgi:hypothetical protein
MLSCRADSMGGKIQSTTDAGSLNTFGRNEIESCAYFIGTSSHCVFSNTIQNAVFRTRFHTRRGSGINRHADDDARVTSYERHADF